MELPEPNTLIKVFNKAYPDGKLRYFKEEGPHCKSFICVYADGQTKKTNEGKYKYWDEWEYPKPLSNCKIYKGKGTYSYHGNIQKCPCLTDPKRRNVVTQIDQFLKN